MKLFLTRRRKRPPARRRGSAIARLLEGRLVNEVIALALLAAAALLALSLLSYDPADPAPIFGAATGRTETGNAAGPVGALLAAASFQLAGLAAYLLPLLILLLAWERLAARSDGEGRGSRLFGAALLMVAGAGLAGLWLGPLPMLGELPAGGLLGTVTSGILVRLLYPAGASVVLLALVVLALLFATRLSLHTAVAATGRSSSGLARQASLAVARLRKNLHKRRLQRRALRKHLSRKAVPPRRTADAREPVMSPSKPNEETRPAPPPPTRPAPTPAAAAEAADEESEQMTLADVPGEFVLPSPGLLNPPGEENPVDEKELVEKARLLTAKLQEFGVGGSVVAIHPGPVITTFEFKPDAGVKYSRVTNLVDDLSLALKAEAVRIERLSGRNTIGVEVPNRLREIIRIREILEADSYRESRAKLPLALGKTIDGRPYTAALERMPHLLIAGATGSGKSVALNSMITSILYRATPEQVKFILVDPKMLELGIYENIPHLICPVVTDPSRAARVLKWATTEMTRRYEILFAHGVRNLDQYNRLVSGQNEAEAVEEDDRELPGESQPLPYIIVVIDELADLMMVSSKEVEAAIQRLAQMARAVGIHLIVATQRPSVDVLTGVIKANFPCRIAFRVSSRTDSNVILDQKGAERLLGTGDMLFLPPGAATLLRVHGALMEEPEALRLIAFLKQQGRPVYNEEILQAEEEETTADGLPVLERDEMFDKAARLVVSMGQASVSHLQRRLGLGYARAARLMDSLEADGIVGPPEGSKPRQVLVPPDYFEEIDNRPT
jgi:S-DNA-T family DNA segregation ATPase FtsK/SpoIIIE